MNEIWAEWKGVFIFFLSMFCGWFGWSLKKRFVPREEHEALAEEVKAIKAKTDKMPTAQDIHGLSLQLTEMKGDLRTVNEKFNGVDKLSSRIQMQVDRMEDFLKGPRK